MNNLNVGVLVSSVLATAGLGVYVYMNNNNNIITEYLQDTDEDAINDNESDHIKSNKKLLSVKSKRRTPKANGTRRKRY